MPTHKRAPGTPPGQPTADHEMLKVLASETAVATNSELVRSKRRKHSQSCSTDSWSGSWVFEGVDGTASVSTTNSPGPSALPLPTQAPSSPSLSETTSGRSGSGWSAADRNGWASARRVPEDWNWFSAMVQDDRAGEALTFGGSAHLETGMATTVAALSTLVEDNKRMREEQARDRQQLRDVVASLSNIEQSVARIESVLGSKPTHTAPTLIPHAISSHLPTKQGTTSWPESSSRTAILPSFDACPSSNDAALMEIPLWIEAGVDSPDQAVVLPAAPSVDGVAPEPASGLLHAAPDMDVGDAHPWRSMMERIQEIHDTVHGLEEKVNFVCTWTEDNTLHAPFAVMAADLADMKTTMTAMQVADQYGASWS